MAAPLNFSRTTLSTAAPLVTDETKHSEEDKRQSLEIQPRIKTPPHFDAAKFLENKEYLFARAKHNQCDPSEVLAPFGKSGSAVTEITKIKLAYEPTGFIGQNRVILLTNLALYNIGHLTTHNKTFDTKWRLPLHQIISITVSNGPKKGLGSLSVVRHQFIVHVTERFRKTHDFLFECENVATRNVIITTIKEQADAKSKARAAPLGIRFTNLSAGDMYEFAKRNYKVIQKKKKRKGKKQAKNKKGSNTEDADCDCNDIDCGAVATCLGMCCELLAACADG